MATAVIAQGGGPTPVINASLAAAAEQARTAGLATRFLGSEYGLRGILAENFIDLSQQDPVVMDRIRSAPGAALGSSRDPLSSAQMERLLDVFRRRDVRYFFYIGGNGSMGTALDIDEAARSAGYPIQIIGIPKTVDNDIRHTDHSPGYGSAGRFYAHAVRDMGMDHRALPSPILICEIMGRNVGWVVAATAFARHYEDDAPHLIYCPEQRLRRERLLTDIETVYRRWGRVFVCICEGQLDENGDPFDADVDRPDNPQHRLASNLGHAVAKFVSKHLNLRARSERPSLIGRCCSFMVSDSDRRDAELVGHAAVKAAKAGHSGQMIALVRNGSGENYDCKTSLVPLSDVARFERKMPSTFLAGSGCDITPAYMEYARPLIGPVEPHARLAFTW
jgi:ATP-dependent phosphofructokinase / diphosphate-dependent phosphofructokinase